MRVTIGSTILDTDASESVITGLPEGSSVRIGYGRGGPSSPADRSVSFEGTTGCNIQFLVALEATTEANFKTGIDLILTALTTDIRANGLILKEGDSDLRDFTKSNGYIDAVSTCDIQRSGLGAHFYVSINITRDASFDSDLASTYTGIVSGIGGSIISGSNGETFYTIRAIFGGTTSAAAVTNAAAFQATVEGRTGALAGLGWLPGKTVAIETGTNFDPIDSSGTVLCTMYLTRVGKETGQIGKATTTISRGSANDYVYTVDATFIATASASAYDNAKAWADKLIAGTSVDGVDELPNGYMPIGVGYPAISADDVYHEGRCIASVMIAGEGSLDGLHGDIVVGKPFNESGEIYQDLSGTFYTTSDGTSEANAQSFIDDLIARTSSLPFLPDNYTLISYDLTGITEDADDGISGSTEATARIAVHGDYAGQVGEITVDRSTGESQSDVYTINATFTSDSSNSARTNAEAFQTAMLAGTAVTNYTWVPSGTNRLILSSSIDGVRQGESGTCTVAVELAQAGTEQGMLGKPEADSSKDASNQLIITLNATFIDNGGNTAQKNAEAYVTKIRAGTEVTGLEWLPDETHMRVINVSYPTIKLKSSTDHGMCGCVVTLKQISPDLVTLNKKIVDMDCSISMSPRTMNTQENPGYDVVANITFTTALYNHSKITDGSAKGVLTQEELTEAKNAAWQLALARIPLDPATVVRIKEPVVTPVTAGQYSVVIEAIAGAGGNPYISYDESLTYTTQYSGATSDATDGSMFLYEPVRAYSRTLVHSLNAQRASQSPEYTTPVDIQSGQWIRTQEVHQSPIRVHKVQGQGGTQITISTLSLNVTYFETKDASVLSSEGGFLAMGAF